MPRGRGKEAKKPGVPADPVLLERDLTDWAGARIADAGRRDALLGRVETLRVSLDGLAVEARVRGHRVPSYRLEVRVAGQRLVHRCSCSRDAAAPCRHAVAAIETLRFPRSAQGSERKGHARRGRAARGSGRIVQPATSGAGFAVVGGGERLLARDERIDAARAEEQLEQRHRARHLRARVQALTVPDGVPRYELIARDGRNAVVTLRGPAADLAHCTCDDYAGNELGTCAHVEKVRVWRARQPKRDRRQAPANVISLWCRPRSWLDRVPDPLCELRLDAPEEMLATLRPFFDPEGWLRPAPRDGVPSSWAAAAVAATRARADGAPWDLAPEVVDRIQHAARQERGAATLADLGTADPDWRRVVERLGLTLHPYQEQGSLFIARAGRGFLADDMGLGKTAQAVAAALLLRRTRGIRRMLVVCPASLKHQWRREIERLCSERVRVVEGGQQSRRAEYEAWDAGFLILNYELVLRDLEVLRRLGADLVVLDEAQRIKNWHTKTATAVKRLESPYAFILTGTPLENRLPELHSLVEFLHPRALGPRWRLLPFHAVSEDGGRIVAYEGLDVLRRRMAGFFLRRERQQVLHQLPERTENTFWTGLTPVQRRVYRRQAVIAARLSGRGGALRQAEVQALLRALTSMRILCNAYAQFAWERYAPRLADPEPPTPAELRSLHSPKLEEFARVLEELLDGSDSKIVVFSQWERMLRLAQFVTRELLDLRDLSAGVFHGGLSSAAREALLAAFHDDPGLRVLFATDAGGQGLNLQESASIVVNLEVPWNPAVLDQRIGRVHRMGQRRGVQVLHFVTQGAIEERVRAVVEGKRSLFEGLLVDEVDRVVLAEPTGAGWADRVRQLVADEPAKS